MSSISELRVRLQVIKEICFRLLQIKENLNKFLEKKVLINNEQYQTKMFQHLLVKYTEISFFFKSRKIV